MTAAGTSTARERRGKRVGGIDLSQWDGHVAPSCAALRQQMGMIGAVYGPSGTIRIRVVERDSNHFELERFDGAQFRAIGSFYTRERALARMRMLARLGC